MVNFDEFVGIYQSFPHQSLEQQGRIQMGQHNQICHHCGYEASWDMQCYSVQSTQAYFTLTLGGLGACPQEILKITLSEIESA